MSGPSSESSRRRNLQAAKHISKHTQRGMSRIEQASFWELGAAHVRGSHARKLTDDSSSLSILPTLLYFKHQYVIGR